MIRFQPETREISLSVRDLIYLEEEPAFGPEAMALRARAGAEAHRRQQEEAAAGAEPGSYEAERSVEYRAERRGYRILVQGRIDGLRRETDRWVVEEVKTVIIEAGRFDPGAIARSILEDGAFADYRLQLELYVLIFGASIGASIGASLAENGGAALPVAGRLLLRNLAGDGGESGSQAAVDLSPDIPALRSWMEGRFDLVIDRLEAEERARAVRRSSAERIAFPFPSLRPHQGELMEEVRTALERGERLLACAPTGVGKTAAVLCAALRHSLETGRRIFYATSRTTQRRIVAETLERIAAASAGAAPNGAPPFRAVILRAREKICPNLEEAGFIRCHEDFCRYARDYAAKVEGGGVLGSLLASAVVTPDAASSAGRKAVACPFELSVDAALEADIIVGDYNHVFDPESGLRRLFRGRRGRPQILIIDEAHGLPSRGRESFSPSVSRAEAAALGKWAREQMSETCRRRVLSPPTAGELRGWCRDLEKLFAGLSARGREEMGDPPIYRAEVDPALLRRLSDELEKIRLRALIDRRSAEAPGPAGPSHRGDVSADPIESFAARWNRFVSGVELLQGAGQALDGSPSLLLLDKSDAGGHKLRLLCLDPAVPLGRRMEKFHSVIALSATLEPVDFHRDALGLRPERTRAVRFPSPFPPENRKVIVYDRISTYFRSRSRDAAAVARLIEEIAAVERGNYLVCFSSYAYLREVLHHLSDRARCVEQTPGMSEAERDRVLDLLREPGSARTLLAVQGGIFSEGVDYPGSMLIGVIIVGPGLPAVTFDEECIRAHFENRFEQGFEYAYLYPAMNRVIQCAGRVIRSETDAGAIVLVGERFSQSQYARLYPPDWYRHSPRELVTADPVADLEDFWKRIRARREAEARR